MMAEVKGERKKNKIREKIESFFPASRQYIGQCLRWSNRVLENWQKTIKSFSIIKSKLQRHFRFSSHPHPHPHSTGVHVTYKMKEILKGIRFISLISSLKKVKRQFGYNFESVYKPFRDRNNFPFGSFILIYFQTCKIIRLVVSFSAQFARSTTNLNFDESVLNKYEIC